MSTKDTILSYVGTEVAKRLSVITDEMFNRVSEFRLRADKPLLVRIADHRECCVTDGGRLVESSAALRQKAHDGLAHGNGPAASQRVFSPTSADISETLERLSRYSPYAFEEELRNGYITLPGGHRAGVAGQTALEGRSVKMMKHIRSVNIRVAHQVVGCGSGVLPLLMGAGPRPLMHTMLISPPGCGKTTLLRDIVRQVSDGVPGLSEGMTVGVVDERSEIAGCCRGIAQNDLGCRTDVLDGCPKAEGMVMLLRSMAPDVIAVDELGGERDARAVEDVLSAGVKLLCTAHGDGLDDVRRNPALKQLTDKPIFERFVVLSAPGKVAGVYDQAGGKLRAV